MIVEVDQRVYAVSEIVSTHLYEGEASEIGREFHQYDLLPDNGTSTRCTHILLGFRQYPDNTGAVRPPQKNAYFAQKPRRHERPTNSQRLWLRLATVLSFLQRPPQTIEDHQEHDLLGIKDCKNQVYRTTTVQALCSGGFDEVGVAGHGGSRPARITVSSRMIST